MDKRTRLGKYNIVDIIGEGAWGVVYKAIDPDIRRLVALKTIRMGLLSKDEAKAFGTRLENEVKAAGSLSHPGIAAVYEYGEVYENDEDDGVAYIAREFIEGYNLREYLAKRRFSLEDTISLTVQLLNAIGYAHEKMIVHRDLRPANVILTQGRKLKVTGFGIGHIESSRLTGVGMGVKTSCYMAPEQYLGSPVDARTDIYAVGMLLLHFLMGKDPYDCSLGPKLNRAGQMSFPRPSTLAPDFAQPILDVVEKALAEKPEERYPTAHAFRKALMAAYFWLASEWEFDPRGRLMRSDPANAFSKKTVVKSDVSGGIHSGNPDHASDWDASTLKQIERQLAVFIGPIAKLLVKKAAVSTTDLDELYDLLADELEAPDERREFLSCRTGTGSRE